MVFKLIKTPGWVCLPWWPQWGMVCCAVSSPISRCPALFCWVPLCPPPPRRSPTSASTQSPLTPLGRQASLRGVYQQNKRRNFQKPAVRNIPTKEERILDAPGMLVRPLRALGWPVPSPSNGVEYQYHSVVGANRKNSGGPHRSHEDISLSPALPEGHLP